MVYVLPPILYVSTLIVPESAVTALDWIDICRFASVRMPLPTFELRSLPMNRA
jgi:hypothetical protein